MKFSRITASATFMTLLAMPVIAMAGDNFEQAKKEAIVEIDNAKAVGYEWRDSRKILKKAEKAEKSGDHAKAMKLANKAKQQGIIAVAQAGTEKNAGPR